MYMYLLLVLHVYVLYILVPKGIENYLSLLPLIAV